MNIRESLLSALRSVRANKVRSGLTMLGIIIGVGAVIGLMSIGQGAQAQITEQIQSAGSNLIYIMPGATLQGGVRQAAGTMQTLTYEDAQAIADPNNCPSISLVSPESDSFAQLVYKGQNMNSRVSGVTPNLATMSNLQLQEGEFFTNAQVTGRSLVAVLGANVAQTLFNGEDPIGKSIRANNVSLRVIGVLVAKGGGGFGSQNDQVYVPITAVQSYFARREARGGTAVSQIVAQAVDSKSVNEAMDEVTALLRQRHHIMTADNDFTVYSQAEILGVANQVTGVLTTFLGGIAAISLLVGGIGIMNIMLVSVTERTREIGIRKAVGAKKRDILAQFLTEAMLLSVLGGVIGIVLGWGLGQLVSTLTANTSSAIKSVVSFDSVVLAVGFSVAVGLFFGIYPAWRAASLHPIDALRYE